MLSKTGVICAALLLPAFNEASISCRIRLSVVDVFVLIGGNAVTAGFRGVIGATFTLAIVNVLASPPVGPAGAIGAIGGTPPDCTTGGTTGGTGATGGGMTGLGA